MTPQELCDINKKVAEAICTKGDGYVTAFVNDCDGNPCKSDGENFTPFRPSTDWNDAMLAAEKAGLFDAGDSCLLRKHSDTHWEVCEIDWGYAEAQYFTHAETGPLCVSLAILHLKGAE